MTNFDVNLDSCVRKNINLGKICPKFQSGEYCEECNTSEKMFKEAKATNNDKLLEDAKTLYARSRVFVNAINVKDEDTSYPVYIYIFPPKVYDDLMGMMRSQRQLDPKFNAFHPITGRNVIITRKGTGKLTNYSPMIDMNVTPIPNANLLEQLKNSDFSGLHDLSKIEEFIAAGYTHMRQFDVGTNVIRLLPPYDGLTVYKELKFHRFTLSQLEAFREQNNTTHATNVPFEAPKSNSRAANINSNPAYDPFDNVPFEAPRNTPQVAAPSSTHKDEPFDAYDLPTMPTNTISNSVEEAVDIIPPQSEDSILDQIDKLTAA